MNVIETWGKNSAEWKLQAWCWKKRLWNWILQHPYMTCIWMHFDLIRFKVEVTISTPFALFLWIPNSNSLPFVANREKCSIIKYKTQKKKKVLESG
jgi:hypothetical protein